MKASEKLYLKYEYLAKKYANRIYSYQELSFEYEDLLQEFKLKIFTSIKAYARRWKRYKNEGYAKPVPLKYYIEAALSNKSKDFLKFIQKENYKVRMDDINFDFGIEKNSEIIPEKNIFMINGVDLLENLTGVERSIFSLFLRGYSTRILAKVYKTKVNKENLEDDEPFDFTDIIEIQKQYLITKYGNELIKHTTVYQSYNFEE